MTWPENVIEMGAPPDRVHSQVESLVSAGTPLMVTVEAPGAHGATMAGTQGTGAPIAATTAGLAGELQAPKEAMFSIGTKSMIVATMAVAVTVAPWGVTVNGDGVFPIGHIRVAPATTN
jgi:hypothetical protein